LAKLQNRLNVPKNHRQAQPIGKLVFAFGGKVHMNENQLMSPLQKVDL